MNNDDQILATLQKLLEIQEQTLVLQTQSVENQKKALSDQQTSLGYQLATGRIYRIAIAVSAIVVAVLLYFLIQAWR